MAYEELFFRIHAVKRMLEYDISDIDVRTVLEDGDVIERGIDQYGMERQLYLAFIDRRPLHVATVDDHESSKTEITTVYEPDLDHWNPGFRTRRTR